MSKPILKQPKIINPKMNSQNVIILSIFIVGCYILYRMISSVQQQVLILKNEVINIKLDNGRKDLEIVSKGFEVTDDIDEDESQSVKSLDIDLIMKKLNSSPLEGSIRRRNLYSSLEEEKVQEEQKPEQPEEQPEEQPGDLSIEVETVHYPTIDENGTKKITIADDDITKKSIGDLRKELKGRGISAKGTKADLIKRLNEVTNEAN